MAKNRKVGRPKRIPKPKEIEAIKSLFEKGLPWADIAENTGIPLRTIMRWKAEAPRTWKDCTVHDRRSPYKRRTHLFLSTQVFHDSGRLHRTFHSHRNDFTQMNTPASA